MQRRYNNFRDETITIIVTLRDSQNGDKDVIRLVTGGRLCSDSQ